jgi:hypothetical protein
VTAGVIATAIGGVAKRRMRPRAQTGVGAVSVADGRALTPPPAVQ